MREYPKLRHNYHCKENYCKSCLEDADVLMEFFKNELGGNYDYLGRYRYWLDNIKKFPNPETEFGWFNPDVFNTKLLDEFIDYNSET